MNKAELMVMGSTASQDALGRQELALSDASARALAAQETAKIQARVVMALQRPRDLDQVSQDLRKECQRAAFTATARYSIARGGTKITGWSVRMAEVAARAMRNLDIGVMPIGEDAQARKLLVYVEDLESNTRETYPVTVSKTIERKAFRDRDTGHEGPPSGRTVVGQRKNSQGETVYIVEATDDEMRFAERRATQTAKRNLILAAVPGWILDDCLPIWQATEEKRVKGVYQDPDGERKNLILQFENIRVTVEQLTEYVGHDLAGCTPDELLRLREVYCGIVDGMTTMHEILAQRREERDGAAVVDEAVQDRLAASDEALHEWRDKIAAAQDDKAVGSATQAAAKDKRLQPDARAAIANAGRARKGELKRQQQAHGQAEPPRTREMGEDG
jgi:hypothetical protein